MERERLFLSVATIMLILTLYFHGLSQNMEYWSYKLAKEGFEIIEADMVDSNEEIYGSERKPNFTYDTQQIVYYIDGRMYNKSVYSYPERTKGESFLIAVRKDNPYILKRCTSYKLTIKDIKAIVLESLVILLFFLYKIFLAFYKKRKDKNKYVEKQNDNQLDLEKQKLILSFCENKVMQYSKEVCFSEIEQRLGIVFNESFKWCLLNLSKTVVDLHMPLWEKDGKEFIFELETLQQREEGLPDKYFLIDKNESYYYCCRGSSERIYAFSKALGITNTPYADIYDYLRKKLV